VRDTTRPPNTAPPLCRGIVVLMPDELVKCAECGAPISRAATQCPKRQTRRPHGVPCYVCRGVLKASQSVAVDRTKSLGATRPGYGEYGGYHDECFRKALGLPLPETIKCGHCQTPVSYVVTFKFIDAVYGAGQYVTQVSPCPNCGNPRLPQPLEDCAKCRLSIVLGLHSAYREAVRDSWDGSETIKMFHAACYTVPAAETERVTVAFSTPERLGDWNNLKLSGGGCLLSVAAFALGWLYWLPLN